MFINSRPVVIHIDDQASDPVPVLSCVSLQPACGEILSHEFHCGTMSSGKTMSSIVELCLVVKP